MFYGIAGASLTTGNEIPASRVVRQLLVDGSNSVVLNGGDLTLDGASDTRTLDLVNGIFETGANTLFVKPSVTVTRTNGWVSGNLKMEYNAVGTKIFHLGTANGYSPVTANVTALAANPSSLTIKAAQGNHPNAPVTSSALKRFWTLTESGDLTATLTFQYLDVDLPAVSENKLELKRYTGAGTTFDTVPATLDTNANTIQAINGISDFSDWTLLAPPAPTAATVTIGGRVVATGRGVSGAKIVMTDTSGNLRETRSNSLGFYRFTDVPTDASYVLTVQHKRFMFTPQVIFVIEENGDVNFTAQSTE